MPIEWRFADGRTVAEDVRFVRLLGIGCDERERERERERECFTIHYQE